LAVNPAPAIPPPRASIVLLLLLLLLLLDICVHAYA
jgi:hypothetical protein